MNLRYRNGRAFKTYLNLGRVRTGLEGAGLTRTQTILYCLFVVGGRYAWARLPAFQRLGDRQRVIGTSIILSCTNWSIFINRSGIKAAQSTQCTANSVELTHGNIAGVGLGDASSFLNMGKPYACVWSPGERNIAAFPASAALGAALRAAHGWICTDGDFSANGSLYNDMQARRRRFHYNPGIKLKLGYLKMGTDELHC